MDMNLLFFAQLNPNRTVSCTQRLILCRTKINLPSSASVARVWRYRNLIITIITITILSIKDAEHANDVATTSQKTQMTPSSRKYSETRTRCATIPRKTSAASRESLRN